MDTALLLAAIRGAERLLIVAAASLCVWLGYRLFQSLPTRNTSDGGIELASLKVTLSKVGPGAFFAAFGAVVLWQAVQSAATIPLAVPPAAGVTASPASPAPPAATALAIYALGDPQSALHARADIAVLNCLAAAAPAALGALEREAAVHRIRLALLAAAWQPGWGDQAAFDRLAQGQIPTQGPIAEAYAARHPNCPAR